MNNKYHSLDQRITALASMVQTIDYKLAHNLKPCDKHKKEWAQYNEEILCELLDLISQRKH